MEFRRIANTKAMVTPEMGLLRKMSPWDRRKDCRRFDSRIGPNTKARIRGAISNWNLLSRYPNIPKMIINSISKTLFFKLKAPTIQTRRTMGCKTMLGTLRICAQTYMGSLRSFFELPSKIIALSASAMSIRFMALTVCLVYLSPNWLS